MDQAGNRLWYRVCLLDPLLLLWHVDHHPASRQPHLTHGVYTVVLQKSSPPQIRQLILYYHRYKEYVDGFVWGLTFAKQIHKRFV